MNNAIGLQCLNCRAEYPLQRMHEGCPACANDKLIANVHVVYDYEKIANVVTRPSLEGRKEGVWKYRELLPVADDRNVVSLFEGGTLLRKCKKLGKKTDLNSLYVKDETRNPTLSFKDRLCSVAISMAKQFGCKVVTVSSSGNHGASTAAYAMHAGLDCVAFTMQRTPEEMLTLMQVYGAKVVSVPTAEDRWVLMKRCVEEYGWYPTSSFTKPMATPDPYGTEGYKTIGYEIIEELDWKSPDKIVVPVGSAAGIYGIWKGVKEFSNIGLCQGEAQMISAETAMAGPIANAIRKGLRHVEKVNSLGSTVCYSIGGTTSSYQGLKAIWDSKGLAVTVENDEVMNMQKDLAIQEALYVEPSSAAPFAAVKKLRDQGEIDRDELIVCIATSTGLKDIKVTRRSLPTLPTIEPAWPQFVGFMKDFYSMDLSV